MTCCSLIVTSVACSASRGDGGEQASDSLGSLSQGTAGTASNDAGSQDSEGNDTDGQAGDDRGASEGASGPDNSGSTGNDRPIFDLGNDGETNGNPGCTEGQKCPQCPAAEHTACDGDSDDPFHALGINCDGEFQVTATLDADPEAVGVLSQFGNTAEWAPREGSKFMVLSTGRVSEVNETPQPFDPNPPCNAPLSTAARTDLPAPIQLAGVSGDCATDSSLIGTGDCSNSINGQFSQGGEAHDYAEARISTTVPAGINSLSYNLAFFSIEYPGYYGQEFNDMYVGWLESESWTGNISFDEDGNPISLNAGFLDFRDATPGTPSGFPGLPNVGSMPLDPPTPELADTCMEGHAGTKWLTTTAPVTPGEEVTLVFAIFDLSDNLLDSFVFLDNFNWGCDETSGPSTTPVG